MLSVYSIYSMSARLSTFWYWHGPVPGAINSARSDAAWDEERCFAPHPHSISVQPSSQKFALLLFGPGPWDLSFQWHTARRSTAGFAMMLLRYSLCFAMQNLRL